MAEAEKKEFKIAFMPSGKRGSFPKGTTILDASRSLGVDLDSVCGGRAICGRCQIELAEGQFAKHGITSDSSHLSDVSEPEKNTQNENHYKKREDWVASQNFLAMLSLMSLQKANFISK